MTVTLEYSVAVRRIDSHVAESLQGLDTRPKGILTKLGF
jgi:hypothetical protein